MAMENSPPIQFMTAFLDASPEDVSNIFGNLDYRIKLKSLHGSWKTRLF